MVLCYKGHRGRLFWESETKLWPDKEGSLGEEEEPCAEMKTRAKATVDSSALNQHTDAASSVSVILAWLILEYLQSQNIGPLADGF